MNPRILIDAIYGRIVQKVLERWHKDYLTLAIDRTDSVHRNIGVESCLNMAFEVSSPPNQEVRDAQKPREDRANLPRGA